MSRNIVPVPVSEDILEHLNGKENRCQYIRELIKKDMNKSNDIPENIKKFIVDFIKNNHVINMPKESINSFADEINSIFDI